MLCPNCGAEIAITSMQPNQTFTDNIDKKYKTVQIGNQTWMAENLDYDTGNSGACVYHKDNPNNEKGYGRLYTWEEAKSSCPTGWHLPSKEEWWELVKFAGGDKIAGKKLKAKSGWNPYGEKPSNGTDGFGFSALPGGFGKPDGSFEDAKNYGSWWSASEYSNNNAYYCSMDYYNDGVRCAYDGKNFLRSVRYVQDS